MIKLDMETRRSLRMLKVKYDLISYDEVIRELIRRVV